MRTILSAVFFRSLFQQLLAWLQSPKTTYSVGEIFFRLFRQRTNKHTIDSSQIRRILIVRLDDIGDIVMTTSFLRELRRNFPTAWLSLIVKQETYNLVELCPYINEILLFKESDKEQFWRTKRYFKMLVFAKRTLLSRDFDLAIVPRWGADYYDATFLAYFSGARWRIGFSEAVNERKQAFNKYYDRLFTHVLKNRTLRHEVEHNLELILFLHGTVEQQQLETWVSLEDQLYAENMLKLHAVQPKDRLIALSPGAKHPKRIWSVANFIALSEWLIQKYDVRIVVLGDEGDKVLGQGMKEALGAGAIDVSGQTTLRQAIGVLRHCALFVGADSSMMHCASATKIPIIEISCHPLDGTRDHANSPLRFGPWKVPHLIFQPQKALPPCRSHCSAQEAHCILGVSWEQITPMLDKFIREKRIFNLTSQ